MKSFQGIYIEQVDVFPLAVYLFLSAEINTSVASL